MSTSTRYEAENRTEVRFVDYAFVTAGLADQLELMELLEHVNIDPRDWERGEDYWSSAILDDLPRGASLSLELDTQQNVAREAWVRRLPPLDVELRAWLDFLRHLGETEDPAALLESIPLAASDLGRLARLWTARVAEDEDLTREANEILASPPQPVEIPPPQKPELMDKREGGVDGTGFYKPLEDVADAVPFAADAEASFDVPPLRAPLPKPKASDIDSTVSLDGDGGGLILPFLREDKSDLDTTAPAMMAPVSDDDVLPFAQGRAVLPSGTQDVEPHPAAGETVLAFQAITDDDAPSEGAPDMRRLAAVSVELELAPHYEAAILAHYGLTPESYASALARLQLHEADSHTAWESLRRAYRAWREKS